MHSMMMCLAEPGNGKTFLIQVGGANPIKKVLMAFASATQAELRQWVERQTSQMSDGSFDHISGDNSAAGFYKTGEVRMPETTRSATEDTCSTALDNTPCPVRTAGEYVHEHRVLLYRRVRHSHSASRRRSVGL